MTGASWFCTGYGQILIAWSLISLFAEMAQISYVRESRQSLSLHAKKLDPKTAYYVKMKGILNLRKAGASYGMLKAMSINATSVYSITKLLKDRPTPLQTEDEEPESDCEDVLLRKVAALTTNMDNASIITIVTDRMDATESEGYTPKVSTWGVYERPKNISQAYGGGEVINREEMEKRELTHNSDVDISFPPALRLEQDNKKLIEETTQRARGCMFLGNSSGAVALLEGIQNLTSYQTEFGGNAKLELAMALETVERVDEARAIYNKLARLSWSDKVRRTASQLAAGLEIYRNVQQDIPPAPAMDAMNMMLVSKALEAGTKNKWSEYKRKDSAYAPWYGNTDDSRAPQNTAANTSIFDAIQKAYDGIILYLRSMLAIDGPQQKTSNGRSIDAIVDGENDII